MPPPKIRPCKRHLDFYSIHHDSHPIPGGAAGADRPGHADRVRAAAQRGRLDVSVELLRFADHCAEHAFGRDRKSTRLNSSHVKISYAVFCLKKKTTKQTNIKL